MTLTAREQLEQGAALLDGGFGVELWNASLDHERDKIGQERCLERLSVTEPELVRSVHESFKAAGAIWLTANTFSSDPRSLARFGPGADSTECVEAAIRLCREVGGDTTQVFGAVGPGTGAEQLSDLEARAHLKRFFATGVDGILIETQVDADTARTLARAAAETRDARATVLAVSLVVAENGQLAACSEQEEAHLLDDLAQAGVDLLCVNCSTGIEPLRPALRRLRALWGGPLGAYPNAGVPELATDGSMLHPVGPQEFARGLHELRGEFGLSLLGGCCGASPAHIRALSVS